MANASSSSDDLGVLSCTVFHTCAPSSIARAPRSTAQNSSPTTLTISAAASSVGCVRRTPPVYEKQHPGIALVLNFGGSGTLQLQIEQGAPVDIFISAAPQEMDALEKKNLLLPGTRVIRGAKSNRSDRAANSTGISRLSRFAAALGSCGCAWRAGRRARRPLCAAGPRASGDLSAGACEGCVRRRRSASARICRNRQRRRRHRLRHGRANFKSRPHRRGGPCRFARPGDLSGRCDSPKHASRRSARISEFPYRPRRRAPCWRNMALHRRLVRHTELFS